MTLFCNLFTERPS